MTTYKPELLSMDEALEYINKTFQKNINLGNVTYLIKYGQLKKYMKDGTISLNKNEIDQYYEKASATEKKWKEKIGNDLNWELSFDNVKEYERTKHVHRLHPYKGKFIPQLVEYFLDDHINGSKKEVFFKPGDIVIDPFCGSGTTLVQSNELGINAIGIDVSEFNSLISNIKVGRHDLLKLLQSINTITKNLAIKYSDNPWKAFDSNLSSIVSNHNKKYFPTPEILYKIKKGEIDLSKYSEEHVNLILKEYFLLQQKHGLSVKESNSNNSYTNKWFTPPIKSEIIFLLSEINKIPDEETQNILRLILSRTVRSCRATTHSDLATLIEPVLEPYYCYKHNKICKPLFSLSYWWDFYSKDTIKRLSDFSKLRTDTQQVCLTGDSKIINLEEQLKLKNPELLELLRTRKAKGVFTSPPYVGLIDYHEQHAYAYEMFKIQRRDSDEIGPQSKGKGTIAKQKYIDDISKVLLNIKQYLQDDFEIFIVANDSSNLYPIIAEKSNLTIVEEYKRPVLNRTEKDKSSYSEKIFRMKKT